MTVTDEASNPSRSSTQLDARRWPVHVERQFTTIPTTCFNCEAACGLTAFVDQATGEIDRFEGNPLHPASRGRTCAKGPATINQVNDPNRITHPLRRKGARGSGRWEQVTWDEALADIASRVGDALRSGRHDEIMYHVGRPGEDGFTERVLTAWGVDGHNSHTNVCSASARVGYTTWMGHDRPSSDFANAEVILLISAHLESGHYFNPHAQRIIEAQQRGTKVISVDPRLSNTAAKADLWLAPWPGTEPFLLLAIANQLLESGNWDTEFVRRWTNWETYLAATRPDLPVDFASLRQALADEYGGYTPAEAARVCGVSEDAVREVAATVGAHPGRLSTHNWRAAGAGNLGGWQTARCLFLLNVLTGSVGTVGGTNGAGWHKFKAKHPLTPPPVGRWNELSWPREYPLSHHEMSILLPHLLGTGRGRLDVYFTRVYNPVWTNPNGVSWIEALCDQEKIGCHVALTPTWSETAHFADYVLPMGVASERHDLASFETQAGKWVAFRQPVLRRMAQLEGQEVTAADRTHQFNPGEVWEENEFWIDLSWRIDPTGELGVRRHFESPQRPGEPISVDEYYELLFAEGVPGLAADAEAAGQTALEYMRDRGAYEIGTGDEYLHHERPVTREQLAGATSDGDGVYRRPGAAGLSDGSGPSLAGTLLDPLGDGGLGVQIDNEVLTGFPTPSRKLELYSQTLADWGWPEHATPGWIPSHVHHETLDFAAGERILVPTFRLPTMIHTRSANAAWLNEISHAHPLWIHPSDSEQLGLDGCELVRVETAAGHFTIRPWRTEGIRPGVVAASHHFGRWRLTDEVVERADGEAVALTWDAQPAELRQEGSEWQLRRPAPGVGRRRRLWRSTGDGANADPGVHQNLAFAVQPDPVSGMQCWHQRVKLTAAALGDQHGDVVVDTAKAQAALEQWLEMTRPAPGPGGLRRPLWMARPMKPTAAAYRLPE